MATNKVFSTGLTGKTFQASSGDIVFTLDSLGTGAGYASAQADWTASSKANRYKWEATIKWVATPTLGDLVRIYAYVGDVTSVDISAGAVTPETKLNNFSLIGQVVCSVAADQAFYGSGYFQADGRYMVLAVWNTSATKTLNATANASTIKITPYADDIQAAA